MNSTMNQQPSGTNSGFQQTQSHSAIWNGISSHGARPSPSVASSSNNTYLMPASPSKRARMSKESYKPKVSRTCGQRPACLVNASVTYCGNNQIYAFGGFDQYTDEGITPFRLRFACLWHRTDIQTVYNHVLRLDLHTLQWTLVDNYGDIPGVRMGKDTNLTST